MLMKTLRHVRILLLLSVACHFTAAFPVQTPPVHDEARQLQVNIPDSGPVFTPLGSSISIPCFISLPSPPTFFSSSPPVIPRVKWTVVSGGTETQILVVRGHRVKINEAYRARVALLNYTSSPEDVSLWLSDLRHSDSGHYRCEVQQGLEDASDVVQLKVKGVVFHYRDASDRYTFSFQQAQKACEGIGAQIATPDQLLAAFHDGYEQCDAGWLADQSVRYPIQVPRKGCYGDMDGQPGVRNYGTMDPNDLFDVYCFVNEIDGSVFYDPVPQKLSFQEAKLYCKAAGAELATAAQLYSVWSEGLDRCSPGWLSDGSVRYPIRTPRDRCGGPQAGIKTIFRFSNQTGFPEPSSLHDVYCFQANKKTSSDYTLDYEATKAEDNDQNVVILMETEQEIKLSQKEEYFEREAQSKLESLPILSDTLTAETHLSQIMNTTLETETNNFAHNATFLSDVVNNTELGSTFHPSDFQRTTSEPHKWNQMEPDPKSDLTTHPLKDLEQLQGTHKASLNLDFNHNKTVTGHTEKEDFLETATLTTEGKLQVKMEDTTLPDPTQILQTTQASRVMETLPATQTTGSMTQWTLVDGSGETSREQDFEEVASIVTTSSHSLTTGFSTLPLPSALTSRVPSKSLSGVQDSTLPAGPYYVDKVSMGMLSIPDEFETPISREEGSSSLESDDSSTPDQIIATQLVTQVVYGVSLPSTESPEDMSPSHSSPGLVTEPLKTSEYKVYTSVSKNYEGSSSYEPETVIFQEENEVVSEFENNQISPTHGTPVNKSLLIKKVAVTPIKVTEDATTVFPPMVLENEEAKVFSTLGLSGEAETVPTVSPEEHYVTFGQAYAEDNNVNSTFVLNIGARVSPTLDIKEDAKIVPSLVLEEDKVGPPFFLQKEGNVFPTDSIQTEVRVFPSLDTYLNPQIVPTETLEEEAKDGLSQLHEEDEEVSSTRFFETEANIFITLGHENISATTTFDRKPEHYPNLTVEKEVKVGSTLVLETEGIVSLSAVHVEEASNAPVTGLEVTTDSAFVLDTKAKASQTPVHEEENKVAATPTNLGDNHTTSLVPEAKIKADHTILPVEGKAVPSVSYEEKILTQSVKDLTVSHLTSQTSKWDLLTSTTESYESQMDVKFNRKTSHTSVSGSVGTSKPTSAGSKKIAHSTTTPTHWSKHSWSQTTTTPQVFPETTQPQKGSDVIPPVDHGLVNLEISFTEPPTLLNLPKERAAVGGTGTSSDACMVDPCFNGGTCTEQDGEIQCLCLPTYGGQFCQNDLEQCEPGWDKFQGFCYRHFSQRQSWEVAEQQCRKRGAHLVSILTPEEQDYIKSNYKEYQWTGLNDKTIEDDFRWSDGSPLLYENWYRGQPDSYFLSGEDCVVMVWHDNGRWSDVPCNYHLAYTCKKGTSSCGPPPKVRNTSIFGKARQSYETNAVVRYHCVEGFQQRLNPLVRCQSGGRWERPRILCIPKGEGPLQLHNFMTEVIYAAAENELEVTEEAPLYWDIKF